MSSIQTLSITAVSGAHLAAYYRFALALQAESTLDELEACILDVLDFDSDHLSQFYVANSAHGKRVWSTDLGYQGEDVTASTTRLCDIYPLGRHKKLYYRYDLGRIGISRLSGKARRQEPWKVNLIPCW